MRRTVRISVALTLLLSMADLPAFSQGALIASATYACDNGQTIKATFYKGGHAEITFGDGRTLLLPQTISADGARYADKDESLVFWIKGNGATITEKNPNGGKAVRHACIQVRPNPGGLPNIFTSFTCGFSIRYPRGWKVNRSYVYYGLGPGKGIHGVSFSVPPVLVAGTNLARDTSISVETLPNGSGGAEQFLPKVDGSSTPVKARLITENHKAYSVASFDDAGAGNRYEEIVYVLRGSHPLFALRYFVHFGAIENYPNGTVRQFDKKKLLEVFDKIRNTLIIDPTYVPLAAR